MLIRGDNRTIFWRLLPYWFCDLAIADEVWLIDYSKVFLTEKTNIILPFLGEYIMSSLVFVKYIRLPTNLLNLVGSTVDPLSSLLNIKLVITGVGEVLQFDILNLFKTQNRTCIFPLWYKYTTFIMLDFNAQKKIHKPPNQSFQIHFPWLL